jgi:hypothetical protein
MSLTEPGGEQPPVATPPAVRKATPRTGRLDEVLSDGPDPDEAQEPAMALLLPRRGVA